jgi:hypothetical protein
MAAKRGSGHGFSRSDRVAEQIRRELADLLRFHLKDQRIAAKMGLVTVSSVEVTPDYAHAKVFYTSLADSAANPAIAEGWRVRLASCGANLVNECEFIMCRSCISSSTPRFRREHAFRN